MITVKDFMETIDYKITEGSNYCWYCYGPDAYRLDHWSGEQDGYSVSIVFDTRTHEVYEASAYDYSRNRAYRLINPDYKELHDQEAKERDVNVKQAWDDVNYVDLETAEDFLEKAQAIVADEDYDTRVSVPLELPDEEMFQLMKLAHERDITLNQLVEEALKAAIDQHRAEEESKLRSDLDDIWPEYNFDDGERGPVEESVKKIKKKKKGK